ncbi:MAG: PIN domain-containing protein [bacterium]|nr:PIN domain-containing protein [bacterium]
MTRVFWDTNLFVYLLEEHEEFGERVVAIRERMIERGDQLCTSAMTLGELLVGPYLRQQAALAHLYRETLKPPNVEVLSFTPATSEIYARIRVDRGIRPADAIQLACAAQAGVDLFLTNDRRLAGKIVPGIQFMGDLNVNIL